MCARTEQLGWQGRVAFGHGSKFSCLPVTEQTAIGQRLGASGVSLAVLPATALVPCDAIRPTEPSFWTFLLEKVMILAHGTSFSAEDQHDIDTHALYRLWV